MELYMTESAEAPQRSLQRLRSLLSADVPSKDVRLQPIYHDQQAVAGAEAHIHVCALPEPIFQS